MYPLLFGEVAGCVGGALIFVQNISNFLILWRSKDKKRAKKKSKLTTDDILGVQ